MLKLRGCCIPLALPIILNADCVFDNDIGGLIVVKPNLSTTNAVLPAGALTLIGRLNITLPVAVVVPTKISRAGLAILIWLSTNVNSPTVNPTPPCKYTSPSLAPIAVSVPNVSSKI